MPKIHTRNFFSVVVAPLAGLVALLPAIVKGIPANNDLPNHLRLAIPFYNGIRAGHLYPGWAFEVNHGFGDPSLRFYPPALYYLLAATRTLMGSWYGGFLLTFVLLSVLGSLGTYFWARSFLSPNLAVCAAVLYAFVPYRINEFYGASLLSEYAAGAVLPFAFGFVLRVCKNGSALNIAGLALSFALLILSNLPLAVIGSLALAFYAVLTIERGKGRQTFLHLCLSVVLGLAASAAYWTTMIAEISWIRNAELNTAYFDYRNNFVFSPFNLGNSNSAGTLVLATLAMLFAAMLMLFWRDRKLERQIKILFALLGVSLFMMTDLSRPIWLIIPKLKEVQFPGRWFAVSSLVASIIAASSIPFFRECLVGKLRPLGLLSLGGLLIALTYSGARIRDPKYLAGFEFSSVIKNIFARDSIDSWLPIWVKERPQPMPNVEIRDRPVHINSWAPQQRSFWVGPGAMDEIRVRTFYYPHWTATAAGKSLAMRPAHDGAILISIPPEASTVQLEFREPPRTRVAAAVSALGWSLIILLLLYHLRLSTTQAVTNDQQAVSLQESTIAIS
jgi:hypothetical protein